MPFGQWTSYHDQGQSLTETGVRQVPESCWPAALEVSQPHALLSGGPPGRQPGSGFARRAAGPGGIRVRGLDGQRILFYRRGEGLVSPPRERILPGVSLSVLAELAAGLGIAFHFRKFRLDELAAADEILMCSTSPCVWPVTRLNGQSLEPGIRGPVYQQILRAWSELVGVDIVAQARRFGFRK